jgi:C1A family cysteine protease
MSMSKITRRYGWKRDLPDIRDRKFKKVGWINTLTLPKVVDLRPQMPPVDDQGSAGSCGSHAITGAAGYLQIKSGKPFQHLSRLFSYYSTRDIEGDTDQDGGIQIRDGIKAFASVGICEESLWPYDISQLTIKPPVGCYTDAFGRKAVSYQSIDTVAQMQQCLADGFPFVGGISVYDSFESEGVASTGIVPMPNPSKETLQGGHALCFVGYDMGKKMFIGRNSWSTSWGIKGYFMIPFDYLGNPDLSDDFWTIRVEEDLSQTVL